MPARSVVAPSLTDAQLGELLELIADADSVELKLTVPESEHYATAAALGVDPVEAQIRQVFFFDTPDLALDRAGVVVRARRIQRKGGDTVVKLRPVSPPDLPDELRATPGFGVEVDAMPGGYVCSASLKAPADPAAVLAVAARERPLRKLLSKRQRALLAARAPAGIEPGDLELLGPILVLKVKLAVDGIERPLVVELWTYPDGSRVLELSTKCPPGDAFRVAAEARALLTARGIDLSGEQQAKTAKALAFFSARLGGGRA
jgi:hypothetical protein